MWRRGAEDSGSVDDGGGVCPRAPGEVGSVLVDDAGDDGGSRMPDVDDDAWARRIDRGDGDCDAVGPRGRHGRE